jgi:hypothetical protein
MRDKERRNWLPPVLKAEDTLVLLGVGDGAELMQAIRQPFARILVVECEIGACRALLCSFDISAAVATGRVRLLSMPVLCAATCEIFLRECHVELTECLHRPNGTLHFVKTATTAMHAVFYDSLREGAQDAIRLVNKFSQAVAPVLHYDVTVISPCCPIFDDLAQCFNRLGLKVQLLRVPDLPGAWSTEKRQAAQLSLANAPSRLVITRNRCLLEAEKASDFPQPEAMIPGTTVMWWWDVPNLAHHIELRHPRGEARAFGFARDILTLLPQGAEWLPPGARSSCVEAGMQADIAQDIDVSFVGQSRLQVLHASIDTLQTVLHELDGNTRAFTKDVALARGYAQLHAYLMRHYLDIRESIASLSRAYPAHAYYLNYVLEMAVTGAFRLAGVERLLAEGIEVAVYGDDDWLKVPGMKASNLKGLIAPADLPALYRRSRLNLNLNFMQVSSTINPKVLDIAAAGGAVLTDYRPELELLYQEPAVRPFAFHSLDELPEKVEALLKVDLTDYRHALRDHTCRHHTLQQRALWIAHKFGLLQA